MAAAKHRAIDAFRRRQQTDEADVAGAALLEPVDGGHRRMAGRQHRVDHHHHRQTLGDVVGQFAIVLHGFERLRVAVKPDVADARRRHQLQEAVKQAAARPQEHAQPLKRVRVDYSQFGADDRLGPDEEDELWRLVQAAFRERRKMIHNVLARQLPIDAGRVDAALGATGITPDRRPQTLAVGEWLALREALAPIPADRRGQRGS